MSHPKKKNSYRYLTSACLAGYNCTYNGRNKLNRHIKLLAEKGLALAICPEVMGGLGIPRENSEIVGGDGADVLHKGAAVLSASGRNLSSGYLRGSKKILKVSVKYGIRKAILKSKSPACGAGLIYDGTFTKKLKKGNGVLTALLIKNGIRVYTEKDLKVL